MPPPIDPLLKDQVIGAYSFAMAEGLVFPKTRLLQHFGVTDSTGRHIIDAAFSRPRGPPRKKKSPVLQPPIKRRFREQPRYWCYRLAGRVRPRHGGVNPGQAMRRLLAGIAASPAGGRTARAAKARQTPQEYRPLGGSPWRRP